MPREVLLFLLAGGTLSAASKLLQFVPALHDKTWLGNLLVLPAAACLTMAALFAWPPYRELHATDATSAQAWVLAALACAAVLSFQLLAMSLTSGRPLGILFVLPLLGAAGATAVLWLRLSNQSP
jgi:hypothetical protein